MKKLGLIILAMLVSVSIGLAQGIGTGSNPHNFSGAAWNSGDELCEPCHTPHNSKPNVEPLWNHELSTDVGFIAYSSSTLDASVETTPDGSSKLCLSCHDGTVALDNFGTTTTGTHFIATIGDGSGLIGKDLSNDHPISFTYDATLATDDGELFDPTVATSGLGNTIDVDMLSAGKMQCSSCHDAHNNTHGSLLVKSNAGSALCLTCHDK